MPYSIYMKRKINNAIFRAEAFPSISSLRYAILSALNEETNAFTEANYTGYNRIPVVCNSTNFSDATNDKYARTQNKIEIRFATVPAGQTQNQVAIGLFDADSGGNLIAYVMMTATYNEGIRPVIEIDNFTTEFIMP